MASKSTAFSLEDAGFYIKNLPRDFDEWDLFNVFAEYGLIGYCRIGGFTQDKTTQFGFVNMLSVEDADKIRKVLKNGYLTHKTFNLHVTDVKCGNSVNNSSNLCSTPEKSKPIHLPCSWLPLYDEIVVEIVDLLPSFVSTPADVLSLSIIKIEDQNESEKYSILNEKLGKITQLVRFETEVDIGFDFLFKPESKIGFRARRIDSKQIYLLDVGKIEKYEKNKCFALPSRFASIPIRVAQCALDGVKWERSAITSFDKIRQVIRQWGDLEKTKLHAKTYGFCGNLNLVSIFCGKSILAERLQRKEICTYTPRDIKTMRIYSRNEMLALKETEMNPKICTEDLHELARKVDSVTIKY